MSIQLKEALDDLTRKKLQVSQAMNDASEEQNEKLIEFIENHFFWSVYWWDYLLAFIKTFKLDSYSLKKSF